MRSGRLHFREQHTKQCDTNIRGEKENNDIPTQYYWVQTTVVQVITNVSSADVDDFKTAYN